MADQFKLKAFVRIDGSGKVIPGGPIFQAQKPKVGKWREINVKECCNYEPTTTTTTSSTSTTTTTTTAAVLSFIGRVGGSSNDACNGSNVTLYTTGPLQFGLYPQSGIIVYSDPALTQPITSAYVASPGIGQVWECFNGELYNQQSCG